MFRNCLLAFGLLGICFSCIPKPEPYPDAPAEVIMNAGQSISDRLNKHIEDWLAGKAPAQIPTNLIPPGVVDNKDFYLKKPEEVSPKEAWATRLSKPINFDSVRPAIPDPNVTYFFLATCLAPFGHKLVIEGEFPHARFFSIQVTPPLNGRQYVANRVYGGAEVSIVDADIEPLPGNVNPYRPNNDRNVPNRKYRVTYVMAKGEGVPLNQGAFVYPYRKASNTRYGSLLVYQGPWGVKDFTNKPIQSGGKWDLGGVWIRIYAPDRAKGALGGMPLPKVWMETPSGQRYFIGSNFSAFAKRANATFPARVSGTADPSVHFSMSGTGWHKSWGILRSMLVGAATANGWMHPDTLEKIRQVDLGVSGRGEKQAPPGNYEAHSTVNNYCNYLGREVIVPQGRVAVLVGKLPTFPVTKNGESRLNSAEVRYWSICGYDFEATNFTSVTSCYNAVRDDEVLINKNRNFIIAYSRPQDRPINANGQNGVTWVNWGPLSRLGLLLRWVAVGPEWTCPQTPHEQVLDWSKSDPTGSRYDSSLINVNWHRGFMQCYLPRLVLMSKAEFEALGNQLEAENFPVWADQLSLPSAANEAALKPATANKADAKNLAAWAFDQKPKTKWTSSFGDNKAWIKVDLGKTKRISTIKLMWGFGAASKYSIEASNDEQKWTEIFNTASSDGGVDVLQNLATQARYLRLNVLGTNVGWSELLEMEVFSNEMPCLAQSTSTSEQVELQNRILLYPNPCRNQLYVNDPGGFFQNQQAQVKIIAADGRTVLQQNLQSPLNVNALKKGVYYLQLQQKGVQVSKPFLKQ